MKGIRHVHTHEGRHIERLVAMLVDDALIRTYDRYQVRVTLAERVVYLIQQRHQGTVATVAEEHADRIERVPEDARHAQQPDCSSIRLQTRGNKSLFDLAAQGSRRTVQMVAIVKADEVETVMREQPQRRHRVEVEQYLGQPVAQAMLPGLEALVNHRPGIERRCHSTSSGICTEVTVMRPLSFGTDQGRRTPPNCSATARPDCRPSSWKPAPK